MGVQREASPVPVSDERFYFAMLGVVATCTAVLVVRVALLLHQNFLTIACDTAALHSAIVNTTHGHWFANNGAGGPNIVGSHTTFLLLLLIPIYELTHSIDSLFVLQVIGVYSTPIPVYLIAARVIPRPWIAFCIALAALTSPILVDMAFAPLHLETWIAAAALWSYYFYLRNHAAGFGIFFAVAVCCAEQAALLYIALGAALLLTDDGLAWRKRYGLAALIGGVAWILLTLLLITPFANGSHHFNIFAYNYDEWNVKSAFDLPLAITHQPVLAFALLTAPLRWLRVACLVGLPMITIFFSWRTVLLLAPLPLYLLMSNQEFFLYFHAYYFAFVFVAGYLGAILFLARPGLMDRFRIAFIVFMFFVNLTLLGGPVLNYSQFLAGRDDEFSGMLHAVFAEIPVEATVYTPHRYSAYLSNRENFVIGDLTDPKCDFNAMLDAEYDTTNVHAAQIDFIVCDYLNDQCGWRFGKLNQYDAGLRRSFIAALLQSGKWRPFWAGNDVIVLKRTGPK